MASAGKSRGGRAGERVRALPTRTFGPASEEPYRRRTSDWVRVVVAVVAIALLVAYHDNPSNANQDLFRFFNGLPNDLQPVFQTLYWAGTLWIVLVVAAAALIARRWRLARDLTIAGLLAWVSARALGLFVDKQGLVGRVRCGDAPGQVAGVPVGAARGRHRGRRARRRRT